MACQSVYLGAWSDISPLHLGSRREQHEIIVISNGIPMIALRFSSQSKGRTTLSKDSRTSSPLATCNNAKECFALADNRLGLWRDPNNSSAS
jgi:hypothetical protein